MTPQEALDWLAEAARNAENGWLHADDVLRTIGAVGPALTLTDAEAGILLALIDRQPLPPGALEELAAITGRLQTVAPATGSHSTADPDDW